MGRLSNYKKDGEIMSTRYPNGLEAESLDITGLAEVGSLEIDGVAVVPGQENIAAVTADDAPAAAESYTQADIAKMVALQNNLKTKLNAVIAALAAAGIIGEE